MQKLSTFRGCGFERLRSIFNKTIAFIKNVCNAKKRRKIAFSQKKCPNTCFFKYSGVVFGYSWDVTQFPFQNILLGCLVCRCKIRA